MIKNITIFCAFFTFNLCSQNLLNDIPTTSENCIKEELQFGFNGNIKFNFNSWGIISKGMFNGWYCGDTLKYYHFDLEVLHNKIEHLQLLTNQTLKKDSNYILEMLINPRFSKRKWAKGRVLKFAFLPSVINSDNIDFKSINPVQTINAMDIRKKDITKYKYDYKALGNENTLIIWAESNTKESVVFSLSDICLHKLNTSCETPFVKITNTRTIEISKKDTFKVFFETDIDTLNQYNINKIEAINLDVNRVENIFCIGYTDSTGRLQYNYNLSLRRALNIQSVLRQKYPNTSITCSAKGALNNSNLSYNRRVEIIIVYK